MSIDDPKDRGESEVLQEITNLIKGPTRLSADSQELSKIFENKNLDIQEVELLKKYIALKETEVRDFKDQLKQFHAYIHKTSQKLEESELKNKDLHFEIQSIKKNEEKLRTDLATQKNHHHLEISLLKSDSEEGIKKSIDYELKLEELTRKKEEWKEKVKEDLNRIKLKEKEHENKYELLKRDSQALLDSKDIHVLELKRKNDALEFELENLEEKLRKSHTLLNEMDEKKSRLIETLKLAIDLLEQIDQPVEELKKKAG